MVVQQQVAILEFLQEKMSARSSLCACTQIPRVDPHSNTLVDKHSRDILHSTNIIIKYHLKWLHSWNKSYDQSRQHIKKQRHHLVDKGPYSQSYGCFSSQVWMWELDQKEGWMLKNWSFWTAVLEKTHESPLGSKEIKPINPQGNQSWIFIGRTDTEAGALILWLPDVKNQLIGKDPDVGKDWRHEEKARTEDEMVR